MQIISEIFKIKNINNFSTEYIEKELFKLNIKPLRWSIVEVNDKTFSINTAYETI